MEADHPWQLLLQPPYDRKLLWQLPKPLLDPLLLQLHFPAAALWAWQPLLPDHYSTPRCWYDQQLQFEQRSHTTAPSFLATVAE